MNNVLNLRVRFQTVKRASSVRLIGQFATASLMLLLARSGSAQTKRFLLEETTVRPGTAQNFESGERDYCAAVVRGGAPSCTVMSSTTFSPSSFYLVFLAFSSFSHYDEGTYTSKGLTPAQAAELSQRRDPTILSNIESAIGLEEECSFSDSGPSALASVTEIHLKPGMEAKFRDFLREVMEPAMRRSHFASFEVYRTLQGGDPDRIFVIRHLASFADLDLPDPMRGAVPQLDRDRFIDVMSSSVQSSTVHVMRLRPELSSIKP